MKKDSFRDIRNVNIKSSALLGIFFYIVIVLCFDAILNWVDTSSYPYIFGLIELVIVSAGIVFYSYLTFKSASQETVKGFLKYVLIQLIPLMIMTILTIILAQIGTDNTFSSNWNATSWIIAPTLFFFLPFGFLYEIISVIPFMIFMPICILYIALLQYAGFMLGTNNRKYLREREAILKEKIEARQREQVQKAKEAAERIEMRQQEMQKQKSEPAKAPVTDTEQLETTRRPERRRYVLDDIEGEAVIKTEAIAQITDEMIEAALKEKKIKDRDEKIAEVRSKRIAEIRSETNANQIDNKEITKNLSKELEELRKRLNSTNKDEE